MTVGTKTGAGAAAVGCSAATPGHCEEVGTPPARNGADKLPLIVIATPIGRPADRLRLANEFDPANVDLGAGAGRMSRAFEMHQVAA